jgi:tetratricopeptide (TPR) repeat protein
VKPAPFALLLALAACAGHDRPAVPSDTVLERERNAGRTALALERPEAAIENYKAALVRAQLRDDPDVIADMGFNLAVAQLRAGLPKDALATTRAIRAELARRGVPSAPPLDLAEATALYRTGDKVAAASLAGAVRQSSDPPAVARAAFLLGLIADDNGDLAGLRTARAALPAAETDKTGPDKFGPEETAIDAAELDIRIALRAGQSTDARRAADRLIHARRDLLDYRGLARALALGAAAALQHGDRAASADLYLRAGRSAAAQNDPATARGWLNKAIELGRDPEILAQARSVLRDLAAK